MQKRNQTFDTRGGNVKNKKHANTLNRQKIEYKNVFYSIKHNMNRSASIIQKWWKKHISIKPPKKSIKKIQISKEEAEKSCNEWFGTENSPMRTWLINAIMDSRQHRDIGKVLAYVAESHVIKWLETKSGRPIKSVIGESYDGKTNDTKPPVRIQIKPPKK